MSDELKPCPECGNDINDDANFVIRAELDKAEKERDGCLALMDAARMSIAGLQAELEQARAEITQLRVSQAQLRLSEKLCDNCAELDAMKAELEQARAELAGELDDQEVLRNKLTKAEADMQKQMAIYEDALEQERSDMAWEQVEHALNWIARLEEDIRQEEADRAELVAMMRVVDNQHGGQGTAWLSIRQAIAEYDDVPPSGGDKMNVTKIGTRNKNRIHELEAELEQARAEEARYVSLTATMHDIIAKAEADRAELVANLDGIKQYGLRNPGCGHTCAQMAILAIAKHWEDADK